MPPSSRGHFVIWVVLEDLKDARLRPYRDLKDRDLARDEGAFVAEGFEVVGHLVQSEWPVRSVLIAASRRPRVEKYLALLPAEVPVFVAEMDLMSKLVGFPIHRGVLACGARRPPPFTLPEGPVSVLGLAGLANHDNVGAAFRNAAAMGATAVALGGSADPLYRKALRVSMGHTLRVPQFHHSTPGGMVDALRAAGLHIFGATPRADATEVTSLLGRAVPERFALLIGEEGAGLSDELLERCDGLLRIQMASGTDSLNAATSAAVLLNTLRYVSPSSFASSSPL